MVDATYESVELLFVALIIFDSHVHYMICF